MNNQTHKCFLERLVLFFLTALFVPFGFVAVSAQSDQKVKRNPALDFDGDGMSDVAVFRKSNKFWYVSNSGGGNAATQWGLADDVLVPGDYDGDGKTDLAVYRYGAINPNTGIAKNTWYILRSSDGTLVAKELGTTSLGGYDSPAPADYDGDGTTDLAVYHNEDYLPAPGRYTVVCSSDNSQIVQQWGTNLDKKVTADYDGDGKADMAIFRSDSYFGSDQTGVWYIQQTSNNQMRIERFGLATDKVVPGDYDGDGKTDLAVYRPSTGVWYCLDSSTNTMTAMQFGVSGDTPVPADFDGDRKMDIAVFRPSSKTWFVQGSKNGFSAQPFGLSDDVPLPNVGLR